MGTGSSVVYKDMALHARNGRIVASDRSDRVPVPRNAEVIDCSGLIAIPGLVNTHHHMYQSFLRGLAATGALEEWFAARTPYLEKLNADIRYHAVKLAHLELLENGTTTVCEFASNIKDPHCLQTTIAAFQESPLSIAMGFSVPNHDPKIAASIRSELSASGQLRKPFYVPAAVVPAADDIQSCGLFRQGVDCARRLEMDITTHLLEQPSEVGGGQVQLLKDLQCLVPGSLFAHAVHLSDSDCSVLRNTGVALVHNPLSNMRLGCGVMPLGPLHAHGITVGIGTDGACNDGASMFESMKVAMGLQRVIHHDPRVCSPERVLRMATIEGAKALGLEEETGSIEVGKRADIVFIDPRMPCFTAVNDPLSQIVMNATPSSCRHVVAGGEFVKRNWEVVGVDRQMILKDALHSFRTLVSQVNGNAT